MGIAKNSREHSKSGAAIPNQERQSVVVIGG
jgi:hypothetical protein